MGFKGSGTRSKSGAYGQGDSTNKCSEYPENPVKSVSTVLTYRPAIEPDLPIIAAMLRQVDQYEIRAASNLEPLAGLTASFAAADESWVACASERPLAIFGVTTWQQHPKFGLLWLLGTTGAGRFREAFILGFHGDPGKWRLFPDIEAGVA